MTLIFKVRTCIVNIKICIRCKFEHFRTSHVTNKDIFIQKNCGKCGVGLYLCMTGLLVKNFKNLLSKIFLQANKISKEKFLPSILHLFDNLRRNWKNLKFVLLNLGLIIASLFSKLSKYRK